MLELSPLRKWHEWKTDLKLQRAESDLDQSSLAPFYPSRSLPLDYHPLIEVLGTPLATIITQLLYDLQLSKTIQILALQILWNTLINAGDSLKESRSHQAILSRLALALENRATGRKKWNKSLEETLTLTKLALKGSSRLQTMWILV